MHVLDGAIAGDPELELDLTADVAQLALGVEDKRMGGGHWAVSTGDLLFVTIVEVGKIELPVPGADFHFIE